LPQHVAFACTDIVGFARTARANGLDVLPMPVNYYDDLAARFALEPGLIADLRAHDLAYDRDAAGEYLHFYTRTVGRVFVELVQRIDAYDGFGAGNAPVRLAAQGAARSRTASR
jgi:4-hydroxyphenylpyruvate dioxygenase